MKKFDKKQIIILGTGGSSKDIIDIISDINQFSSKSIYDCLGFLDDDKSKWGKKVAGIKVLGPLNSASKYKTLFVNGIGNPANFFNKEKIIEKTAVPLDRFETIIHPSACVSKTVKIGKGTVISQNVTISSNVNIGNHVIILPNAIISHDDVVGDYSSIASGACLSGKVRIGRLSYLGANSSIKEGVSIGEETLIGIGSVVLENIPSNSVYVGNPAKFLKAFKKY